MSSGLQLTLSLSGGATAEGGAIRTAVLDQDPFLIGRDGDCDWVVRDEEGLISRRHCELRRHGDALVLVDHSSNGTYVGPAASRAVREQPTTLPDTTTLHLGPARIEVEVIRGDTRSHQQVDVDDDFFGVRRLAERAPPPTDDLDLLAEPGEDEEDFFSSDGRSDGLALDEEPPLTTDAAFRPADARADPPPRDSGLDDGIPDDWLEQSAGADAAFDPGPAPGIEDPLDDLERALGGLDEAATAAPAAPEEDRESETKAPLPRGAPPTKEAASGPAREPVGPADARRPAEAPPAPAEDAALTALFAAAGLRPDDIPPDRRAAVAEEIGRVFNVMAEGYRVLLAQRRDVKTALGITATQFEMGANPLKWSPDAETAVAELLQARSRAYRRGEEAVSDAIRSLQAHQLSLVAGIKAAIRVALGSFAPDTLEERLGKRGLAQVVPQLRKAELWDRFVANYDAFAERTNDDIRNVLGRELDMIYENPSGAEDSAVPPSAPRRGGGPDLDL